MRGTRSKERPWGSGRLAGEQVGNAQLTQMLKMLHAHIEHDIHFLVESFGTSALWWVLEVQPLIDAKHAHCVTVDRCVLGLLPPDVIDGVDGRVQKPTRLMSNMPRLSQ